MIAFPYPSRILLSLFLLTFPFLTTAQAREIPPAPDLGFPTALMSEETLRVIQLLEGFHYRLETIDPEKFVNLAESYMSSLDTHRLFFLESDLRSVQDRFAGTMEYQLRKNGDLSAAFAIFELYRQRVQDRITWIKNEVESEFDFSGEDSFVFNRRDLPWPEDAGEADRLWRHRLKFELLQDLLNDEDISVAKENVTRRYERMERNLLELRANDVQESFLSTLMQLYDPHSVFYSADSLEDFSIQMRLSLVGIGALLAEEDGYCVVREIIPGGPAHLNGQLQPNDRIVAVAQGDNRPSDVIGLSLRRVVEQIRGEKGSVVRLIVIPGDAADPSIRREISLVRDVVQLNASRAKATVHEMDTEDGLLRRIGVIEVPSFYGNVDESRIDRNNPPTSVTEDVRELLAKLNAMNVDGIILDLRRNGGGLLTEAIAMTGLFVGRGPVVQIRENTGNVAVRPSYIPRPVYEGPLAVLVSRFSASASEIVAGALQNYGRALVIGDSSTHGKGTVQAVLEMRNFLTPTLLRGNRAGASKLTVQKFYLPSGESTQERGVVPDLVLPSVENLMQVGERNQPNALAWDRISPVSRFSRPPVSEKLISYLQKRTEARMSELEEFDFLRARIEFFREQQERTSVSLNLEERRAQTARDTEFREYMDGRRRELASLNFPSTTVLLDRVSAEEAALQERIERLRGGDPANEGEEEDSDGQPLPNFDVQLRESLRILTDAIQFSRNPWDWSSPTQSLIAELENRTATFSSTRQN